MLQHANFSAMFFKNHVTSGQTFPFAQLLEGNPLFSGFNFFPAPALRSSSSGPKCRSSLNDDDPHLMRSSGRSAVNAQTYTTRKRNLVAVAIRTPRRSSSDTGDASGRGRPSNYCEGFVLRHGHIPFCRPLNRNWGGRKDRSGYNRCTNQG